MLLHSHCSMKKLIICSVCIVAAIPCLALATTYDWNPKQRPPVSLAKALSRAQKAIDKLDNGKDYYCIDAHMLGNKDGTAEDGAWWLIYARNDGQQQYVGILFRSGIVEVDVKNYMPPDPKLDGQIKNIDDAEKIISDFLKAHNLKGTVIRDGSIVTVSVNVRQFNIHTSLDSGEFSKETKVATGPSAKGFILKIHERKLQAHHRNFGFGYPFDPFEYDRPYSISYPHTFVSSHAGKELYVQIDYGRNFSDKMAIRIFDLFVTPIGY